jgi:SAM-dependent methyltransferase
MTAIANAEMARAWDGDEGEDWARDWEYYDRSARDYQAALNEAAAIQSTHRVLDIGCGNGESTRIAARAADRGSALGIDLSTKMLARARALATAEGISNANFVRGDAQVHPFESNAFDVAISRFGAMFFADRAAAMSNVAGAIKHGGRIVMLGWQELGKNEWLQEIRAALSVGRDLPAPPAGAPGPFGFADADGMRDVLGSAGFEDITIESLEVPVWVGKDGEDAFRFISSTGVVRGMLQGLDEPSTASALNALRETMSAHDTGDGVVFGSAAWLITATRTV